MTLAQECEAIWPVGWESNGHQDSATATVDGVALRCEKHSFRINGKSYVGYDKLRDQLQAMMQIARDTPRLVPDLVPDVHPVLLELKALLEPLDWTPSENLTTWQWRSNNLGHWELRISDSLETLYLMFAPSNGSRYLVSQCDLAGNPGEGLIKLLSYVPRFP